MFKKLMAGWKAMSTVEKIKLVLDIVCDIGVAAVAGGVGQKATEDRHPVVQACATVGMMGVGMAAGNVAKREINDMVDFMDETRKQMKQKREAQQHAD